ncbi:HNH endonuclease [Stakelama tenebrarum]|uniref:HNH endonuclease n=1 Tax=Stakelama tenebrarum TaxID=2711215 RepID=UPI001D194197|nr:HNH endonuclease [Sphingosinithalassobacter tenebrarum]
MKRKAALAALAERRDDRATERRCALCDRPLGHLVEQHHPLPKSEGGRDTVPVHPICHRAIHSHFTNAELARGGDMATLRNSPRLAAFRKWIAKKPPDFHAPTRRRKRD